MVDLDPIPSSSYPNSSRVKTKDSSKKKKFTFNKNEKSESPKEDNNCKKFKFSEDSKVDSSPIPSSSSGYCSILIVNWISPVDLILTCLHLTELFGEEKFSWLPSTKQLMKRSS